MEPKPIEPNLVIGLLRQFNKSNRLKIRQNSTPVRSAGLHGLADLREKPTIYRFNVKYPFLLDHDNFASIIYSSKNTWVCLRVETRSRINFEQNLYFI